MPVVTNAHLHYLLWAGGSQKGNFLVPTWPQITRPPVLIQGGSNMTGTDLCVNKPHCAAAVRP